MWTEAMSHLKRSGSHGQAPPERATYTALGDQSGGAGSAGQWSCWVGTPGTLALGPSSLAAGTVSPLEGEQRPPVLPPEAGKYLTSLPALLPPTPCYGLGWYIGPDGWGGRDHLMGYLQGGGCMQAGTLAPSFVLFVLVFGGRGSDSQLPGSYNRFFSVFVDGGLSNSLELYTPQDCCAHQNVALLLCVGWG